MLPFFFINTYWTSKDLNTNLQSFHPELLRSLTESISTGYNGALLLCGASTEKISALVDHCIVKQVESKRKLHSILAIFLFILKNHFLLLNSVSALGKSVSSHVTSERGVVHLRVIPSGLSFYLTTKT